MTSNIDFQPINQTNNIDFQPINNTQQSPPSSNIDFQPQELKTEERQPQESQTTLKGNVQQNIFQSDILPALQSAGQEIWNNVNPINQVKGFIQNPVGSLFPVLNTQHDIDQTINRANKLDTNPNPQNIGQTLGDLTTGGLMLAGMGLGLKAPETTPIEMLPEAPQVTSNIDFQPLPDQEKPVSQTQEINTQNTLQTNTPIEIPIDESYSPDGRNIRRSFQTLKGSIFNDKAADQIIDNAFYTTKNLQEGWDKIHGLNDDELENFVNSPEVSQEKSLAQMEMLRRATEENSINKLTQLIMEGGTSAGQYIQAMSAANKLTREGALMATQRILQERVPEYAKTIVNSGKSTIAEMKNITDKVMQDVFGDFTQKVFSGSPEAFNQPKQFPYEAKLKTMLQKQIKQNLKLGDIVKTHYNQQNGVIDSTLNATKESLIKNGISKDQANRLVESIKENINKSIEARKQAVLNKLLKPVASRTRRDIIDRLMEYEKSGALDEEQYRNIVEHRLKIPHLTPDLIKKIGDLADKVQKLPEGRDREVAKQMLLNEIASNKKIGFMSRLVSARATAMLSNPATAVKNVLGHGLWGLADTVSQIGGVGVDQFLSAITKERTLGFPDIPLAIKSMGSELKTGLDDAIRGIDTSGRQSPLHVPENNWIPKFIPKSQVIQRYINAYIDICHSLPYRLAYEGAYKESIANQLKASGLKAPTKEMALQADKEALKRSFQDMNGLSETAVNIVNALNKNPIKIGSLLVPFPKVPSTLLARALEFSPAGAYNIAKELIPLFKEGKSGFSQRDLSMAVSRTALGSYIMYNVYDLAKKGIITGGYSQNPKERAMEYKINQPVNSLNIDALLRHFEGQNDAPKNGDKYITYDWLAPVSDDIRLTADMSKHKNYSSMIGSAYTTLEESSPLANTVNVANPEQTGNALNQLAASLPESFNPAIVRAIANSQDPYIRKTYDENTGQWAINKLASSIPELSKQLPAKTDINGNPIVRRENNSLFDNLLNPAKVHTLNNASLLNEVQKLADFDKQYKEETRKKENSAILSLHNHQQPDFSGLSVRQIKYVYRQARNLEKEHTALDELTSHFSKAEKQAFFRSSK